MQIILGNSNTTDWYIMKKQTTTQNITEPGVFSEKMYI